MTRLRLVQLPVPQPAALGATGNVPLAAGCLAVSAEVHGLRAEGLRLEVVAPELTDRLGDTLLADYVARDEPDFVGLSLYLWNVERSLHLAREVKKRSPRTRVLIGGPEVSADNPFVLSQRGFDLAVTGEAEDTFAELMQRLLAGHEPRGMAGVAVRTPLGLSPFGPAPSANFALSAYPSPYLSGLLDVDGERPTYVETVRGCRSHCTYCFYPRSSNVLRVLDVARSAAVVASLRERGARHVTFLDPTFNHRPELEALLAALADVNHDRAFSCFGEVRAEGLTSAHAKALARAGFTRLEIGLQSVNVDTLRRIKRYGSPDKVAAAAHMLQGEGIEVVVDLIIGLPGDDADDVARGVAFLHDAGLGEHAQVFPLSLLPGTALRASAEVDGVIFDPAPPYRVRCTRELSEEALVESLFAAEDALGRRLDEEPRPLLVAEAEAPCDVFRCELERPEPLRGLRAPGAAHVALWLCGDDLFAQRERISQAIALRLAVDPYAMLDVVLAPRAPFPLDLLDLIHAQLTRGTASYASRTLAHRSENLQRRVSVVLGAEVVVSRAFLIDLAEHVNVYRDQHVREALAHVDALGEDVERARILDPELDVSSFDTLAARADPAAIAFASRTLEARWVRRVVESGS